MSPIISFLIDIPISEHVIRKRKKTRESTDSNVTPAEEKPVEMEGIYPKIETVQTTLVDEIFENKKGKKKARTTFTGN